MFKRIFILTILIVSASFYSCEDMIEIDPPLDQVVTDDVFASDVTAKAALSGLYSSFSQSQTQQSQMTIDAGLAADELRYYASQGSYAELQANTYTSLNSAASTLFSEYYAAIYRANSILEGVQKGSVSNALKIRMIAESKFIRAYCYFYLASIFGDVPLVLQTDVNVTATLPRAAAASVFEQVLKDLAEAKADLPEDYSNSDDNRYGVNKYVVSAMQARVYLYTGNYALAESSANEVIAKTDLYQLIASGNISTGVFERNNTEAIFQFMGWLSSTNLYTAEGNSFVPNSFASSANYGVTDDLFNAFETGDLRRTAWITDVTIKTVTYHIPYKYKNTMSVTPVATGEYPTVLRLAEQYLIRAEARARIGNDLAGARADLNAIRTRAGLDETVTADADALVTEIIVERRKELFLEIGLRWLDLKRTGLADAVLGNLKTTWRHDAALFPIPQGAIDANLNLLPNNPGY